MGLVLALNRWPVKYALIRNTGEMPRCTSPALHSAHVSLLSCLVFVAKLFLFRSV
jgi:hypothetical protein